MKNGLRSLLGAVSSLKLTVVCLSAAMVLVFVGTLAQVDGGIHDVQKRYFQSLFVRWPDAPGGIPVFPGGHLIIIVLLINLLTAHIRRFRWTAAKIGIHLIHGGLVVMLLGALLTDFLAVESTMRLSPSQTSGYAEDQQSCELAIVETSGKDFDTVMTIPQSLLQQGVEITDSSTPVPRGCEVLSPVTPVSWNPVGPARRPSLPRPGSRGPHRGGGRETRDCDERAQCAGRRDRDRTTAGSEG